MIRVINSIVEVRGSEPHIFAEVSSLVHTMVHQMGIDKKDIMYAVELGLKSDEEIEKEARQASEELVGSLEAHIGDVEELLDILKRLSGEADD